MAKFGKDIMAKEFMLDPHYTFVNQGSYGSAPRRVIEHRTRLIREMEEQPDVWFRWNSAGMWNDSVLAVSEFLGSKPTNLVLVNNTTTGVNAVLRSIPLQKGDGILLHSWTYYAVKNTADYVASVKGLEVLYVDIPMPLLTIQSLLDAYESMLQAHANIKIVVLDHISSVPTALMPLPELIALCRKHKKLVLVDGAHSPGQLNLNLEALGVDFYVGNLHKWGYAPRGCAILWIHPDYHSVVFPVVTSNLDWHSVEDNFSYQGTADYTTYYSAAKGIEFYREIGGFSAISAYCSDLVERGANHLVQRWGTRHFTLPASMRSPHMRMVRVPDLPKHQMPCIPEHDIRGRSLAFDITTLMKELWDRFQVICAFVSIDNEPWCRISASVYNEFGDYEKLAVAVLTLLEEQKSEGK